MSSFSYPTRLTEGRSKTQRESVAALANQVIERIVAKPYTLFVHREKYLKEYIDSGIPPNIGAFGGSLEGLLSEEIADLSAWEKDLNDEMRLSNLIGKVVKIALEWAPEGGEIRLIDDVGVSAKPVGDVYTVGIKAKATFGHARSALMCYDPHRNVPLFGAGVENIMRRTDHRKNIGLIYPRVQGVVMHPEAPQLLREAFVEVMGVPLNTSTNIIKAIEAGNNGLIDRLTEGKDNGEA